MWLIAALALHSFAAESPKYELTGRLDPPAALRVFLHGVTEPFETSTLTTPDGRFHFRKLPPGVYTLAVPTARGQAEQTVELTAGTVDSKGRLDIALRIDDGHLDAGGAQRPGVTVSATVLSIPDTARKEYEQAGNCLGRRDSDCASAHFRRAVEIAPRFTSAWNQLGVIAYQTRDFPVAESDFRKALEADPTAFEPLVNLGGVLLNLGKPRDALAYNQRAVQQRPDNALANAQLGLSYFLLNDLDRAETCLKTAVRLDPAHFSHPQLPLAEIYLRRGNRQAAVRVLRQFLEEHPDAPEAAGVRRKLAELDR